MQNNAKTIAFIGAGNMARSLIGGLLAQGYPASSIIASDPSATGREQAEQLGDIVVIDDNHAALRDSELVVLAIKPQVMEAVLRPLADDVVQKKPLVISIAAGISCQAIQRWLGNDGIPVVRCMPNTPALMRVGASGLYASEQVDAQQRQLAEQLLSAVGVTCWVDKEPLIDAVTAISGSGPAYFFLIMEIMQKIGTDMGLPPEVARRLTLQTAGGAATMALNSDVEVETLRKQVTSPNGTTEAAINQFFASKLDSVFEKALIAAKERSVSLAKELVPN